MTDDERICGTNYTYDWVVDRLAEHFKVPKGAVWLIINGESALKSLPGRLKSKSAGRIGVGQGFLSIIAKLSLEWVDDKGKLPGTVVLKVAIALDTVRLNAVQFRCRQWRR